MSELSDMTGASRPVVLGGKEWRLSPLSLGDFAEFDAWAEEQFWRKTEKRVARMPEGLRDRLLEQAYERLGDGGVSVDAMMTVAGTARLVWLSLRRQHSDVTPEQTAELVTLGNRKQVQATLDQLNGLRKKNDDEDEGKADPKVLKAGKDRLAAGRRSSRSSPTGTAGRRK